LIIGIYKITNPNNKSYIGQSLNIKLRESKYKNLQCLSQPKIYRSLKKHGFEKHIFEIIEECSLEELDEKEYQYKKEFIDKFGWENALFCQLKDYKGGYKSQETKDKISRSNKGKHTKSQKEKDYISNFNKGHKYNLGKKRINRKIRKDKNSGYKRILQEGKTFGRKPGFICSEQTKDLLRKPLSEERKIKLRKPRSEQAKINMSIPRPWNTKSVLQYDLDGNLIKEWDSIKDAYLYFNKTKNASGITACIKKRQKTAFGYKWEMKNKI